MKYGEIITLGRHRLMCGDATNRDDVMKLLDGAKIDLVLTDPPYSSGGLHKGERGASPSEKYQTSGTVKKYLNFERDNMDAHSWLRFCHIFNSNIIEFVKDCGYFLEFTDWRQYASLSDAMQTAGIMWRGTVVWDKTEAARPNKGYFRNQCEFILFGTKGKNTGDFILPGCYRYYQKPNEKMHITSKPVNVITALLKCVGENSNVLDCFGGSGTTLIACEITNRNCFMMEISPEYCEIIRERYEKLKEAAPLFNGGNKKK